MALPEVQLPFQNGNTGLVDIPEDGIFGVVVSSDVIVGLTLNEPVSVRSLADCTQLGIIDTVNNHFFYKFLFDFFQAAGNGTKLWIFPFSRAELMSAQFTPDISGIAPVQKMLDVANGEIRGLFTCWNPENTITLTEENGLDEDVWATKTAAQTFCENYTAEKKSPVWVVIEGYNFTGDHADLPDLETMTDNRCEIFIGNTEQRTGPTSAKGATLGAYAGRLAQGKVSTNPGRVKDGALYDVQVYIKDTPVENYDVTSIHDKGYVTFRRHPKKSGYYITNCPMATSATDDYHLLTHRRVIDKAYIIGYGVASQELLEDFPLTSSGTIDPIYAKQLEQNIINAVFVAMTLNDELSYDKTNATDKGCICKVDLTHPVGSTGTIKFESFAVAVRGYAEMIIIPLGFVPLTTN